MNDALVEKNGRQKPHPLFWVESRGRPGQFADVTEALGAYFTAQQLCVCVRACVCVHV